MDTERKRDGGARANTPQDETEAAHRSGKLGADKPGFGKLPAHPARPADKKPNEKGPEFEEGGQYPGKRPGGK
ncbi:hypothetical protein A6B37_05195 [Achromobacter sp. HZ01]|uniref:hypothetical protein n=1 Tax=Achromobacter sp. HZ01 TaxID=1416886 RepID=UPI000DC46302|nr:hypothetical protein [Achromobacter sp. HZ01]RAP65349.1 hypothetical protein A6B37_05195 [Achromobacter sp. HZ01]